MKTVEITRIREGQIYAFHVQRVVKQNDGSRAVMDVSLGTYRVEGFVTIWPVGSEGVLYQGLDGPDRAKLLVCSLMDFTVKFRLIEDVELLPEQSVIPTEVPEKIAGYFDLEGTKMDRAPTVLDVDVTLAPEAVCQATPEILMLGSKVGLTR